MVNSKAEMWKQSENNIWISEKRTLKEICVGLTWNMKYIAKILRDKWLSYRFRFVPWIAWNLESRFVRKPHTKTKHDNVLMHLNYTEIFQRMSFCKNQRWQSNSWSSSYSTAKRMVWNFTHYCWKGKYTTKTIWQSLWSNTSTIILKI